MSNQTHPRPSRLPLLFIIAAIAILLMGAYLRAYRFDDWPPGLSHDEALNGIDANRMAETGVIPYYLRDGRPEPLFRIFLMFTVGLIGPTRFGLRIGSFFFGVLGIAAAIRAGRHVVPPGNS